MNLEPFLREREDAWAELETLVARANGRTERLGPDDLRRLGALYRAAAADLAIARRRYLGDPLVRRLESVVGKARYLVYDAGNRRGSLVSFFARDYWRLVRGRPGLLAISGACLLVPAILALVWSLTNPAQAAGFVPGAFTAVTEHHARGSLGISIAQQAATSSAIFTNNIRVTLLSFAAGIVWGIGSAIVVVFNGAMLGVVAGLAVGAGNGRTFVELVAAHGILELSCIVVGAAAGMRLGAALVDPGHRPRGEVLVEKAREAVQILLGTAPWLIVAGLVEGFVTPSGFGLATALGVGCALGTIYWGLVIFR